MKEHFSIPRLLVLAILLLAAAVAPAQSIRFNFNSGTTETFQLDEVRKITFTGTLLNLHLTSGPTQTWEVGSIRNYTFDVPAGLKQPDAVVSEMRVFPNPSSGLVTINYSLQKPAEVSLEIFDMQGKLIRQITGSYQAAGLQSQTWDGRNYKGSPVSAGRYICNLTAGGQVISSQIIIQ